MSLRTHYPAFINIAGLKCVVVGGGKVSERKVRDLLKAQADVTVISPEATSGLQKLAKTDKLKLIERKFKIADLKGAFLAIAATALQKVFQGHVGNALNIHHGEAKGAGPAIEVEAVIKLGRPRAGDGKERGRCKQVQHGRARFSG